MVHALYQAITHCLPKRMMNWVIGSLVVLLCGCETPNYVSLSFILPNGAPLIASNAILIVNHIGVSKVPTPGDILRWIGIETFKNPLVLTCCDNESRQMNETGCIQLPQGRIARAIYAFVEEGEQAFLYYGWFFPEHSKTITLFLFDPSNMQVLNMKEHWAYFLGHILLAESDLLAPEQISIVRRYITPLASERYYKWCQNISPETLSEQSKKCGVEVREHPLL